MIKLGFKRLTDDAILPVKAHPTDSGFDLFANADAVIGPGETKVIKTGIAIHLPPGYEAQVRPRSGVTSKTKLRVQLGTIDNDYTGEVGIIVDNIAPTRHMRPRPYVYTIDNKIEKLPVMDEEVPPLSVRVYKGDKLAQLIIAPVPLIESYEVDELPTTERGSNGFGSSGY